MSELHPALMSASERRKEIAVILAKGILRLHQPQAIQKAGETASNSLDFRVFPSVHAPDDNKKQGDTGG